MNNNFKPEYPKITLSNKDHEFSGWLIEKSDIVLKELSYISSYINKNRSEENSTKCSYDKKIDAHLSYALFNAVKLISVIAGCGEVWSNDDHTLILDKGVSGYDELMKKYGMPKTEFDIEHYHEINDEPLRLQLLSAICGDRINRTAIHSILCKIHSKTLQEKAMEIDIDKVSMNEMSWEQFVDKYQQK